MVSTTHRLETDGSPSGEPGDAASADLPEALLAAVAGPDAAPRVDSDTSRRIIANGLAAVRQHLGMEVAFVGRFDEQRRWFDFVDADEAFAPIEAGTSDPLEETYCARVVDGRIPELIRDTAEVAELGSLPVTHGLPVGAHVSVPMLGEGVVLGTLCCFSREADPDLRERDLDVLRMFAEVIGTHVHRLLSEERAYHSTRDRVLGVLVAGGPQMALQPIVDVSTGAVHGFEALARFPLLDGWTPDRWFAEAEAVGLGPDLEAAAIRAAVALLPRLAPDVLLSVNVSAGALCHEHVASLVVGPLAHRLVVELTEHTRVTSYERLEVQLARLRSAGVRIAVDDAGSGYSGLEHILELRPEVLKLDRALVRGLGEHVARQAMVEAMLGFTRRTGAVLVAEGVETAGELETLRGLGVRLAQGFYLGRPSAPA